MKKLLVILLILISTVAVGQSYSKIRQKTQFNDTVKIMKSIIAPSATLDNELVTKEQVLLKADTVPLSDYIDGANNQMAIFRGDSAVIGLTTGAEGQVIKVVSGVPTWSTDNTGGSGTSSLYAVTTSVYTNTQAVLTVIPQLTIDLAANSSYEVEFCLIVGTSADAYGTGYSVNLSSTSGAAINGGMYGSLTQSTQKIRTYSSFNTLMGPFMQEASMWGVIMYRGIIKTGSTAPTLTISHYKYDSGTSTVTVNSYLKATLMP